MSLRDIMLAIYAPFKSAGHGIARFMFSPTQGAYPFPVNKGTSILFLRHDALGDMLATLPMIRAVKNHYPDAIIHILCTESNASILDHADFIDHVHIVSRSIHDAPITHLKDILRIRRLHVDIIVNCLTSKMSKNGIITRLLSHANTLSSSIYAGDRYAIYVSRQSMTAAHASIMWEKMMNLGRETFNLHVSDRECKPFFPSSESHASTAEQTLRLLLHPKETFVAINISVGQQRNQWSIDAYDAFIHHVQDRGFVPLLFAMERDLSIVDSLKERIPGLKQYPSDRHVCEVGEALRLASWGLSPDTGFLHLATAAGCPMIALYCYLPDQAKDEWIPYRIPHLRIFSTTNDIMSIHASTVIDAMKHSSMFTIS